MGGVCRMASKDEGEQASEDISSACAPSQKPPLKFPVNFLGKFGGEIFFPIFVIGLFVMVS
jgi:hypothetical protein